MSAPPLSDREFASVVRLTPLIAIDLIIRDGEQRVLLGLRTNAPAQGFYFVPGGRVRKDETLRSAFARILLTETGSTAPFEAARFLGIAEHFYAENRFGDPDFGTHYVVMAYAVEIADAEQIRMDAQHSAHLWMSEAEILESPRVHANTKAYFRCGDADSLAYSHFRRS